MPVRGSPVIAVVCAEVDRLMATITTRPGRLESVLTYTITLPTLLEAAATEVSPKLWLAPSKLR